MTPIHIIPDDSLGVLSRLDEFATVPADLRFDDAPLETIVYGEPGSLGSAANIYRPAAFLLMTRCERSGINETTDVCQLASEMVRSRHSLIDDEFELVKDLLHLVCRECLDPVQQIDAEATLGAMAAIAESHHDLPLRVHAELTLGFWYHWKNLTAQAAMVWDALRQLRDLSESEVGPGVACAARAFCELTRAEWDNRLRGIDQLRQSVLEGKSRIEESSALGGTEEPALLGYFVQILPAMIDLASGLRVTGQEDQVAELADHLHVVCAIESVAGAHHPLTLVPLRTLIRFLQDNELHEIASSLEVYVAEVEEWNSTN